MSKYCVFLVCMLAISVFPISEEVEAGLGESSMWETISCDIDADETYTVLLDGTDGNLYVGTATTTPFTASIYQYDGSSCTRLGDTTSFYVYSAQEYNGTLYFGTRDTVAGLNGEIWTYTIATGTFSMLANNTWWNAGGLFTLPGWIQTMIDWDDRLFIAGTYSVFTGPWTNFIWAKWCATAPCDNAAHWNWANTSRFNLGPIDDFLDFASHDGNLYGSTYDWPSVLRYYNNNASFWYSLNQTYSQGVHSEYVDGVDFAENGYGIYGLTVMDDVLHAFTYGHGLNWSLACTGCNWEFSNRTTTDGFGRSILFGSELYTGSSDESKYYIDTFDNLTFRDVFNDNDAGFFRYFTAYSSELYVSTYGAVYVRRESAPRIRITSPHNNQSIHGFWRLNAKVDTDKTVDHVIFRFANYDDWFNARWDTKLGIYYYEYLKTDRYPDGSYYLEGYLNHSDGSYSVDNISFVIDNDRYEWIVEDDDGILKETYNLPWIPPVDMINGPDYIEGLTQLDPYYIFSYTVIEASSSPAASHTSWNPYDITENDVEILEDIVWLSEVPDTLNIWINDSKSTTGTGDDTNLVNDAGVTSYNLAGQNITIQADTTAFSFIRKAKIKIVNSFLWTERTDGSYGASLTFYDNMSADFTSVVFFVGAAEKGNLIIPIDVMEATVWDQTNGMSLHNGKEFTTTSGGFWLAISTLSGGTSRTFVFNYYALKQTIATQLILSPYVCDTSGSPYSDKPIRCLVNHDQPSDEDFKGTVIFDLSEVSMYGKINWNRVLMRTQTDNQVYVKGTDWYSSGDYQITMPNKEFESGESVTWEIFIGTIERSPDDLIDSFSEFGWVIGFLVLFLCFYWLNKGLNEGDKSKARNDAWKISGLWFMLAMLLLAVWWFARFG